MFCYAQLFVAVLDLASKCNFFAFENNPHDFRSFTSTWPATMTVEISGHHNSLKFEFSSNFYKDLRMNDRKLPFVTVWKIVIRQ